jgi:hypothetical protein
VWLQQDGALPHFGWQVTAFLNQHLPHRRIGRGGPVAWPTRSPDLALLDCFLRGHNEIPDVCRQVKQWGLVADSNNRL